MSKIVFLDFDGVLNSHPFIARTANGGIAGLDPEAVVRLNRIVAVTGAEIVVSSSWRHGRSLACLRELLNASGFVGTVRGKTPDCARKPDGSLWHGAMRGSEAQAWITDADLYGLTVESFVILDDDSDMGHLAYRHVKTSMATGLLDEHVDRAIAILARSIREEGLIVMPEER